MAQFPIHGSKWFDCREFVDQRTFGILGVSSAWMIDPAIVRVCDLLREKAGVPVVINNWHFVKPQQQTYKSSGFRATWDRTGGILSQHRLGRAADVKVLGMSPEQVHALIFAHEEEFKAAGLTTLESLKYTKTWVHVDCRPKIDGVHPIEGFLIVIP